MRIFLLLIFLLPQLAICQDLSNSIGVITLSDSNYNKTNGTIEFLNEDGTIWYEFNFYYDDSDGKWDYPNEDFKVLALNPDYFLLKLTCTEQTQDYFTVVVNEEKQTTKKLRISSKFELQTWDQYIISSYAIRFDLIKNPILNTIQGDLYTGSLPKEPIYQALEIKEEWVKIKWIKNPDSTEKPIYEFGWIKWKAENKMMIDIYFLC